MLLLEGGGERKRREERGDACVRSLLVGQGIPSISIRVVERLKFSFAVGCGLRVVRMDISVKRPLALYNSHSIWVPNTLGASFCGKSW